MTPADIARAAWARKTVEDPWTIVARIGLETGLEMAAAWHEAEMYRVKQLAREQRAKGNREAAMEWGVEGAVHALSIDAIRAMKAVVG